MIKKVPVFIIYMLILGSMVVGMLGYSFYREAWIFPPSKPANMEELKNWSELDLWRLMEAYNCGDMYMNKVPDDLKELNKFCGIVSGHWNKKYDERKIDDAREGADRLRQE